MSTVNEQIKDNLKKIGIDCDYYDYVSMYRESEYMVLVLNETGKCIIHVFDIDERYHNIQLRASYTTDTVLDEPKELSSNWQVIVGIE